MSGIFKGVCDTAAGTATKVVTCPEFTENDLVVGAIVFVTFTATNSAAVADIALSVNNTTAKHITYMRNATESNLASAGYLRANMTYRFVYNGTYWVCDTDYDANTNTIGYLLRTSGTSLVAQAKFYRYRLLFTSADGTKWVPANTSSSTNSTASRTVNQTPIDPFGPIVWYNTTTSIDAGVLVPVGNVWQQYYGDYTLIGYSFNRTGAAQTMTANKPIYIKCAPQSNGSAIIDADTPYVQDFPTTDDGKIYIYLGRAQSATKFELEHYHPIYYFKNGSVRLWTGQVASYIEFEQNSDGTYTMKTTRV